VDKVWLFRNIPLKKGKFGLIERINPALGLVFKGVGLFWSSKRKGPDG